MFLEALYLVLSGGFFAGLCAILWIHSRKCLKEKIPETRRDEKDAVSKSSIESGVSVHNLSKEILNDYPHSLALQKRILFNLRMVEYKLAELEQFLVVQGLSVEHEYQQIIENDQNCRIPGSYN